MSDPTQSDPTQTLLPPFLRKLATDIENGSLSDEQLQRTGEFYASFLFHEDVENKGDTTEEDFKKFISMGYYVYSQISKGKNL